MIHRSTYENSEDVFSDPFIVTDKKFFHVKYIKDMWLLVLTPKCQNNSLKMIVWTSCSKFQSLILFLVGFGLGCVLRMCSLCNQNCH